MPQPCSNCGKSEQVVIKDRRYCINCGEPVYDRAPSTKADANKPSTANKGILDLARRSESKPHPAHSVHGHRKSEESQTTRHREEKPEINLKETLDDRRHHHAQAIKQNPRISHFAPSYGRSASAHSLAKHSKTMSPHLTYELHRQLTSKHGMAKAKVSPSAQPINPRHLEELVKLEPKKRVPRRRIREKLRGHGRMMSAASVVLAALVLTGYITYLNVPSLSLRVAAARAGIDAQLPRYTPAGYAVSGPVTYQNGQITIRLTSKNQEGSLIIIEQKKDWDTQTLLENYVLLRSPYPRNYIQNGLTVYVYNGNSAAWINNRILYTIEGDTNLGDEQILHLASSL